MIKGDKIKKITVTAMLLAVAIVLSFIEMLFPLPGYGLKLGVSNIVIMYALIAMDGKTAFSIGVIKSLFVFLTRGMVSGILSASGFMLAFFVMLLLLKLFKGRVGYLLLSVLGAIGHNAGQLVVVALLYSPVVAFANIPFLGIASV